MSNPKDEVLKLIQKKRDKIRNARRRRVRQEDVYNIIVDFVKDMDKAISDSESFMDFDGALREAARKLDSGITRLDPSANINVIWNKNDDMEQKWDELQVESVLINWSEQFANKTDRGMEESIDIGHLFLEGYFN